VVAAIERKLGFDTLGFLLDTFVAAIIDPKGNDGRRVDVALRKHLGLDDGEDRKSGARAAPAAVRRDASGLNGLVRLERSPAPLCSAKNVSRESVF